MLTHLRRLNQRWNFNRIKSTPRERVISLIKSLRPIPIENELIRLGPNGDGGYLIPDDLHDIKSCFSPGTGNVTGFEQDCLKRGMKVYMADKSVDAPMLKGDSDQYHFIKKYVGCTNNADFMTLDAWAHSVSLQENEDLLLQMDIAGGEYISLINVSDSLLSRFRIIVLEFHSLQFLWNPYFFDSADAVLNKILQTHSCVHIHPNNYQGIDCRYGVEIPRVAEFTFLRKDRIRSANKPLEFPHKLDHDNSPSRHIPLPKVWHTDL